MPGHSTVIHNVARWLDPHPWPRDEPVAVTVALALHDGLLGGGG